MRIIKTGDFTLDGITLISSLPDMGRVGGLVTEHLRKTLDVSDVARITIHDKPWVNQRDGIIDYPVDEYVITADKKRGIVIFSGRGQPQESYTVKELAKKLLSTVREFGRIDMVISAGGYLPSEQDAGDVFGVATDAKSLDLLKSHNVGPLSGEVNSITWFNGLVLGHAKNMGIAGIGLFGKIEDAETPQYRAASNVVRKISDIIGVKIDTAELDCKIVERPAKTRHGPGIG